MSCELLHSHKDKGQSEIVGKLTLTTFKLEIAEVVASFYEVKSVFLIRVNTRFMLCSSYWLMMDRFPELQEK